MEEFPSGQRGQTVNLLRFASVVRIHPPPPARRKRHIACDELFHFITKLIAHSFCCASPPNWPRCRWAPVWRRRFAAVPTFKRAEIISVGTAFLPGKVRFATTSFYACGKKRRHPPASLLLLSKSNPLRWASIWFWVETQGHWHL